MRHRLVATMAVAVAVAVAGYLVYPAARHDLDTLRHDARGVLNDVGTPAATTQAPAANNGLAVYPEPQDGTAPIQTLIIHARRSVDLTMYELVDPVIEAELAGAAARGVTVRVVLDQNLEKTRNAPAYDYLHAHGVHVVWAPRRYAATHQKTLTVDAETSVIMTLNLVRSDYPDTRDFAVVDTNPADVAAIETTFAADDAGTAITAPAGADLVWSPGSQPRLAALINSARTSIAVENEEMGDKAITAALCQAARRGVTVTVTMTASSSWTTAFDQLTAAGVHLHLYPNTSKALYIHAKTVVVDHTVFIGSENFSNASLDRNRELGIVTTNTSAVNAVTATLRADYAAAPAFTGR